MEIQGKSNGVHYLARGEGPPVILIHGMAASSRQWDLLSPSLVGAGYSVFALDLQGHGASAKPKELHDYHVEELYSKLDFWIDSLNFNESLLIIGHSVGAYLTLLYTLRNIVRIRGIVLVNPYYSPKQLSFFIRRILRYPRHSIAVLKRIPAWAFDIFFDVKNKNNAGQ